MDLSASAPPAPVKQRSKNIFGRSRPDPLLNGGETRSVNEMGEDHPRSVNQMGEDNPAMFPVNNTVQETPTVMASYDKGTPYVPEDQIAQIHEGEEIIPADQNPNNPDASASPLGSAFTDKSDPNAPLGKVLPDDPTAMRSLGG